MERALAILDFRPPLTTEQGGREKYRRWPLDLRCLYNMTLLTFYSNTKFDFRISYSFSCYLGSTETETKIILQRGKYMYILYLAIGP